MTKPMVFSMSIQSCFPPEARLPSTRAEAKAVGSRVYFTGASCKRGHIAPRFVSDSSCKLCRSTPEAMEKSRDRSREWHANNRDAANQSRRLWQVDNKERAKKTVRAWSEANKPRRRVIRKRRRAIKAGLSQHYTFGELRSLWSSVKHACACCGAQISEKTRHVDHIVALSRGGKNTIDNIQFLCETCNKSKGARDPIDFMRSKGFLL